MSIAERGAPLWGEKEKRMGQEVVNTANGMENGLNRCPHCGSTDTVLNPKTGKLKCNYCRSEFEAVGVNAAEDISQLTGEVVGSGATAIIPDVSEILTFKCTSCGAEIVVDTNEATHARCHWCRHTLTINEQQPNGAVPDMVLPFKMEKANAEGKIREFVNKRQFFAHPTFKKEFTTENVMGVYLPYMVVDVNARASLKGQGEHLVRTYTRGSGDSRKTYYDADLYGVTRDFDVLVDDLTIESSKDKLNQNLLINTNNVINAIMPFDVENCVAWNANYLKGYASEKRDAEVADLRSQLWLQVKDVARYRANESLEFYDRGVRWDSEDVEVKGTKWKSAYLPIWLYSYMQEEKGKKLLHYCAVNARTGETMGSVPINKKRLFGVSFAVEILGIILGMAWFIAWMQIDTDDNPALFGLAGLTPGFIYYWIMTNKYRNMSARHYHEKDTRSTVANLKKTDTLVQNLKGLRNSRIEGANNTAVQGTVAKGASKMAGEQMAELLGVGKMLKK